jgi:hypothetical protein
MNKIVQKPAESIHAYRTRIAMAARAANREAPGVVTEGAQIEAFCAHLYDPQTRAQMAHRLTKDRERVRHGHHSKMKTLVKAATIASSYQTAELISHETATLTTAVAEPVGKPKTTSKSTHSSTCTAAAVSTAEPSNVADTLGRMNAFLARAETASSSSGSSTTLIPPAAFKSESAPPAKGVGFGTPTTTLSAGSTPTKGLSPYLRCHNCSKNHLLKDCPDARDEDKISKNVEARRAAKARRAAAEASASGAEAAAAAPADKPSGK